MFKSGDVVTFRIQPNAAPRRGRIVRPRDKGAAAASGFFKVKWDSETWGWARADYLILEKGADNAKD